MGKNSMSGQLRTLKSSVLPNAAIRTGEKRSVNFIKNMQESLDEIRALWSALTPKEGQICAYCGGYATDEEHVTPRAWIERAQELADMGINIKVPEEKIVMACRECNLIASARIFETFTEKKNYIRWKLSLKYKKYIDSPQWDDDELEELRGEMRRKTTIYNEALKAVQARLRFIGAKTILKHNDYFKNLYG